ncbi:transposase [Thalassobacterium sedimentorum]|uniref:transposase n=1 Tax=Thalassobacterium sedimentorum TaxID=3041258 RepID=UPI003CE48B6B
MQAAEALEAQGCKQKLFGQLSYAAGSWKRKRRVIHKAEHTDKGANPRFVVTSLRAEPESVYRQYCKRGEMENNIKKQMMLYSDRTSAISGGRTSGACYSHRSLTC